MIIQILSELKEEGYLPRGRHPTVAPFFASANVAFRRHAFLEVGGFDPQCITGEDCDISARLSSADWELYTRRDAIVCHKNPTTIREVFRQWYGYGRYHPYVFAKHNERAVEIYVRLLRPLEGERYVCLFYRKATWAFVLFITNFLLLHAALLATGAAWLMGMNVPVVLMVGYRGYTRHGVNTDTAATYTERFLMAFGIPFFLVENDGDADRISTAFAEAARTQGPVVVLVGDEYHGFNR